MLKQSLLLVFLVTTSASVFAESAGPFDESKSFHVDGHNLGLYQHYNIPVEGTFDKAIFIHPDTPGPWKLVMIHHGSPGPKTYDFYPAISRFFLQRGYAVVIPVRRGYGATGGPKVDSWGTCDIPRTWNSALTKAEEMEDIWTYMRSLPDIQKDNAILLGKSHGGFGVLAMSKDNPAGIAGVIDLAGGVSFNQSQCGELDLVASVEKMGETARLPTVMLYTENDHNIPVWRAQDVIKAYTSGNPNAKAYMFPPIGEGNGHKTIEEEAGVKVWGTIVSQFLKSLEEK